MLCDPIFPLPQIISIPILGRSETFPVRRIYCVGRNYLAHVKELNNSIEDPPFFFQKQREMIVQSGGTVRYPGLTNDFQHEIELVIAMGSGGLNISVEKAESHIFGFAVGLDMTRRDMQNYMKRMQRPWEVSKSFEDSAPCGTITPIQNSGLLSSGSIELKVNGIVRQHSNVDKLIWSVPKLIVALSEQAEILAGDLIYTGTPEGVGPVLRGDILDAKVANLEPLFVTII